MTKDHPHTHTHPSSAYTDTYMRTFARWQTSMHKPVRLSAHLCNINFAQGACGEMSADMVGKMYKRGM